MRRTFGCPRSGCCVEKVSLSELEVHIKWDHLEWLPFACPVCGQQRPISQQIRDHMRGVHGKEPVLINYVDNAAAEEEFSALMFLAVRNARLESDGVSDDGANNPINNGDGNRGAPLSAQRATGAGRNEILGMILAATARSPSDTPPTALSQRACANISRVSSVSISGSIDGVSGRISESPGTAIGASELYPIVKGDPDQLSSSRYNEQCPLPADDSLESNNQHQQAASSSADHRSLLLTNYPFYHLASQLSSSAASTSFASSSEGIVGAIETGPVIGGLLGSSSRRKRKWTPRRNRSAVPGVSSVARTKQRQMNRPRLCKVIPCKDAFGNLLPIICQKCDKVISHHFRQHASTHLISKRFVCPECPKGQEKKAHFKQDIELHIQRVHPGCVKPCVDNGAAMIAEIRQNIEECYPFNSVSDSTATDEGGMAASTSGIVIGRQGHSSFDASGGNTEDIHRSFNSTDTSQNVSFYNNCKT